MVLYLISFYCGTSAAPRDLQHVPKLFTKEAALGKSGGAQGVGSGGSRSGAPTLCQTPPLGMAPLLPRSPNPVTPGNSTP